MSGGTLSTKPSISVREPSAGGASPEDGREEIDHEQRFRTLKDLSISFYSRDRANLKKEVDRLLSQYERISDVDVDEEEKGVLKELLENVRATQGPDFGAIRTKMAVLAKNFSFDESGASTLGTEPVESWNLYEDQVKVPALRSYSVTVMKEDSLDRAMNEAEKLFNPLKEEIEQCRLDMLTLASKGNPKYDPALFDSVQDFLCTGGPFFTALKALKPQLEVLSRDAEEFKCTELDNFLDLICDRAIGLGGKALNAISQSVDDMVAYKEHIYIEEECVKYKKRVLEKIGQKKLSQVLDGKRLVCVYDPSNDLPVKVLRGYTEPVNDLSGYTEMVVDPSETKVLSGYTEPVKVLSGYTEMVMTEDPSKTAINKAKKLFNPLKKEIEKCRLNMLLLASKGNPKYDPELFDSVQEFLRPGGPFFTALKALKPQLEVLNQYAEEEFKCIELERLLDMIVEDKCIFLLKADVIKAMADSVDDMVAYKEHIYIKEECVKYRQSLERKLGSLARHSTVSSEASTDAAGGAKPYKLFRVVEVSPTR